MIVTEPSASHKLGITLFMIAGIGALLIGLFAVGYQALQASSINQVHSLSVD